VCILMQSIQEHRDDREFMKGLSLYFLGAFGICWLCLGLVVLDARLQEDWTEPTLATAVGGH
jgi:hypothetical protein